MRTPRTAPVSAPAPFWIRNSAYRTLYRRAYGGIARRSSAPQAILARRPVEPATSRVPAAKRPVLTMRAPAYGGAAEKPLRKSDIDVHRDSMSGLRCSDTTYEGVSYVGVLQFETSVPVLQHLDCREGGQRRGVDDHCYCGTAQADSPTGAVDRVEPATAP